MEEVVSGLKIKQSTIMNLEEWKFTYSVLNKHSVLNENLQEQNPTRCHLVILAKGGTTAIYATYIHDSPAGSSAQQITQINSSYNEKSSNARWLMIAISMA